MQKTFIIDLRDINFKFQISSIVLELIWEFNDIIQGYDWQVRFSTFNLDGRDISFEYFLHYINI